MFIAQFRLKTFIQRAICEIREIIDFANLHPVRELQRLALHDTVEYIRNHMTSAIGFYTPRQVLDTALSRIGTEGHYLEFGVFRGGTIRYLASCLPAKRIHGFDSFEGLPESWSGYNMDKSTFTLHGRLPKVPSNVTLHAGWFDKTLPEWLEKNPGPIAFVHIDCDLYSSTKAVFDLLGPRLRPGTVIAFDEYFGYPNWRNHEFKAFQELVSATGISYEYIAFARIQVAVRITSVPNHSGSE